MKTLLMILTPFWLLASPCFAQKAIRDQSITYQQERMVFKQWDRNKFTPKPGFLYTNPLYWLTWAWHTGYKNTDRRPLSAAGPQTQRLGLVLAMQNTDNTYKLDADTVRNTALTEGSNYSGLLSETDPLWLVYYKKTFKKLLEEDDSYLLSGLPANVRDYLASSGILNWYKEEASGIRERLDAARTTNADRGSRILAYHRLLGEYRNLNASWTAQRLQAAQFLRLQQASRSVRHPETGIGSGAFRTDKQIADVILSSSKL